ncbi:MAG: AtpZ/AtpI family protein [Candidatus Eisenbacteria bacterium]|nr:AtpZ/AtpI family protein [Candidatus Eisenbacteria bacterium]MBU1949995.1 AtpZ/AtpI family protein [Candidatus Eisenbacteria bacterium]
MVPFLMATGPIVGYFLGKWLDSVFGTKPILSFVFVALGFIAGIREMVRLVRRASRDMDRM